MQIEHVWEGCGPAGEHDQISETILANWINVQENQDASEAQVQGQSQVDAEMQGGEQPGREQLREEESGGYSEPQPEHDSPGLIIAV